MAKQQGTVYLGYEEDVISDKNQMCLNYRVNKIGGHPDWPPLENIQFPTKCPLCGLHRFLIIQCYAPIENSVYHRTLYVFACVNPNCWVQSESWSCVRSQIQDNVSGDEACSTVAIPFPEPKLTWCNGADEWDENDNDDTANGNFLNAEGSKRFSDEDEESISIEMDNVEQALGNLQVFDTHNANMSPVQGAIGAIGGPVAAAELEGGDEPGLVTVDTPTAPTDNLQILLNQTAELPIDVRGYLAVAPMQFIPKFIYVEEEYKRAANCGDDKVTQLLNKYRKENDMDMAVGDRASGGAGGDDETYEESAPLHGDTMFHSFLTRLSYNPGQILRYSRHEKPILGAPLPSKAGSPEGATVPRTCARCRHQLICELQLLPSFTRTLQLPSDKPTLSHLHFLSVLVFSCSQSCWELSDVFVNETVVFQPEI